MSKRTAWEFGFAADRLETAARAKVEHHRARESWWRDELAKAEADLRATGVEFRSMPVTGGERLDAVLDPQKQQRVNECRGKLNEHQRMAEEYETYARAFQLSPDARLTLDVGDIQFFGL